MVKAAVPKSWELPVVEGRRSSRPTSPFPLAISANQRYIVDASGDPFLLHGDTPWMLGLQLSQAQVDTFLDDRQAKGFTCLMFEAPGWHYSSQTPEYNNSHGEAPFTTMSPVNWAVPNEAYWLNIDYIVNACFDRGIACMINPAYYGFNSTEGWQTALNAESDADLQTFGAFLGARYTQGNVIWCLGGDDIPSTGNKNKQWKIMDGIRTVRTTDLVTAHTGRNHAASEGWAGFAGFNLDNIYIGKDGISFDDAAEVYAASPTMPFFMIEAGYEGEVSNLSSFRLAAIGSLLSGCCGYMSGHNPLWGFGEPNKNGGLGAANSLTHLNDTGQQQLQHVKQDLLDSYDWHLLVPKTDTSLVTTSLGTSTARIYPALANDGSFAMIFTPNVTFTVNMTVFAFGSVRARWFNPVSGAYTAASGSPLSNSGTHVFTAVGERVLVLDEEPS